MLKYPEEMQQEDAMAGSLFDEPRSLPQKTVDYLFGRTLPERFSNALAGLNPAIAFQGKAVLPASMGGRPFDWMAGHLRALKNLPKSFSGWFNPQQELAAISPSLHVHEQLSEEASKALRRAAPKTASDAVVFPYQFVDDKEYFRVRRLQNPKSATTHIWSPEGVGSHAAEQELMLDAITKLQKAGLVGKNDDLIPHWKYKFENKF